MQWSAISFFTRAFPKQFSVTQEVLRNYGSTSRNIFSFSTNVCVSVTCRMASFLIQLNNLKISKKSPFWKVGSVPFVPQYVMDPQLQSTYHYTVNHYVKTWHMFLGVQIMGTQKAGWGAQKEKIRNVYTAKKWQSFLRRKPKWNSKRCALRDFSFRFVELSVENMTTLF